MNREVPRFDETMGTELRCHTADLEPGIGIRKAVSHICGLVTAVSDRIKKTGGISSCS